MPRVCPTCPYKWVITQQISMRTHLERKQVDDVMGGDEAWASVDQTNGECYWRRSRGGVERWRSAGQCAGGKGALCRH